MKFFKWFRKLASKHWEFSPVNWLSFCYFHFKLLLVGLKYWLLTPLKNYYTKKPVKKLTTSYSYMSRLTGYILNKKITLINRIALTGYSV